MSVTLSSLVDWSPEVLPCAPRPINGELLSSWVRRLAGANGITLAQLYACIGDLLGRQPPAVVCDYGATKAWRLAIAAMARIPERCVWVLDLQQQFPAIGREWFLHDPARPEQIAPGFCPECFREQIAARKTLHVKAAWAAALATRCFAHQLPLYRYCPWCGEDQPAHFQANAHVQCHSCEHALTIRRWTRNPVSPEPLIAALERAMVETLAGRAPDPAWAGESTARSFRDLVSDLLWMLTTPELVDPRYGPALVDRIVPARFQPKYPYGDDFVAPFYARSWVQREAVVCAMIQVLLGSQADGALGVCSSLRNTADFRPFVEILRAVQRNQAALWTRIRRWPGGIQDRAGGALRFLEAQRKSVSRRKPKAKMALFNPADKSWNSPSAGRADTGR
jgi:TniQ protein